MLWRCVNQANRKRLSVYDCQKLQIYYQAPLRKQPSQKHLAKWRMETKSVQRNYRYGQSKSWRKLFSVAIRQSQAIFSKSWRNVHQYFTFCQKKTCTFVSSFFRGRKKSFSRRTKHPNRRCKNASRHCDNGASQDPSISNDHVHVSSVSPIAKNSTNGQGDHSSISNATAAFLKDANIEKKAPILPETKRKGGTTQENCRDQKEGFDKTFHDLRTHDNAYLAKDLVEKRKNEFRQQLSALTRRGIVKNVRLDTNTLFDSSQNPNSSGKQAKNSSKKDSSNLEMRYFKREPIQVHCSKINHKKNVITTDWRNSILPEASSVTECEKRSSPGLLSNHSNLLKNIKVNSFSFQRKDV